MKKKRESLVLGRMLQKIAPRIGASVIIEPEWGIAGQITFKDGRCSYFRYNTLDLNPTGASEVACDKDYSNFFMEAMGYPTVPGSKTFFSDQWGRAIGSPRRNIDAAYRHARRIGFPVIVKPNSGSQGVGVSLVHNRREFYTAVRFVFNGDRIVLVQQPVHGTDYRLVVLDREVISAYERIPLNVIGDGKSTIGQLLKIKQKQFVASSRDTQIKTDDPRIASKLSHQGLSFRSVPTRGQKVYLLDNANLSTGGDAVDVTGKVHPAFKKLAVKLTRDMGLRLCGVDLMVQGDISQKPMIYWVLEINSAPGLDHYAKMGKAQAAIVEHLYLQVLKHMER
jgi:D-alanine-D-alanine ligase-like ATP-grasp enzyme